MAGGGRSSGRGQARWARSAGATADRGCCGQHKSNTSPGPGGVQHADHRDDGSGSGGITKDNVTVRVDAVVDFRVVDPIRAIVNVQNYLFAVS